MSVPTFLQHLGLGIDASEKGIRRAYAQRVKLIDQTTRPDDFQLLREAYDAALAWHEARERGGPALDAQPGGKEAALQVFEEFTSRRAPAGAGRRRDGPRGTLQRRGQGAVPALRAVERRLVERELS